VRQNPKPFRLNLHTICYATFFALAFSFSLPAKSACPEFPEVPWWSGFSHETAVRYVERRYKGNWTPYIAVWTKQYSVLNNLHQKNFTAIVRGKRTVNDETTKYTIKLKGVDLADYIKKVKKRVEILECLAGKQNGPGQKSKTLLTADLETSPIDVSLNSKVEGRKSVTKLLCLKCHGKEALRKFNHIPNLNGQNILYLARQLVEFKTSQSSMVSSKKAQNRHSAFMKFKAKELDDDMIWNISAYFADNSRCFKTPSKVRKSNKPKIVETCSSCHGQQGITNFPEVPNLLEQSQEYLLRQLKLFKNYNLSENYSDGLKDSRYHLYMSRILKGVGDKDIESLAIYYSSLPCKQ
jgi:cytochrome c553